MRLQYLQSIQFGERALTSPHFTSQRGRSAALILLERSSEFLTRSDHTASDRPRSCVGFHTGTCVRGSRRRLPSARSGQQEDKVADEKGRQDNVTFADQLVSFMKDMRREEKVRDPRQFVCFLVCGLPALICRYLA